jgi:glycerophosphoryl diester phosphodiesterase
MKNFFKIIGICVILFECLTIYANGQKKPIIIAHRGASAYLPEDTLIAIGAAYLQNPDYIKWDTSMTKDNKIVVAHDIFLDYNTNVKQVYPNKARADGHFYIHDFTLDEIKKLTVHERTTGVDNNIPVYPDRFPVTNDLPIRVPTLQEVLELIKGMNKSTENTMGISVDLKAPGTYKDHGHKFAETVLNILAQYGYKNADSKCYVSSFDPSILTYLKNDLHSTLKLAQSIYYQVPECPDVDYSMMTTKDGLKEISSYANAVDPAIEMLFTNYGKSNDLKPNDLCKWAHEDGMIVRTWTLRNDDLPADAVYTDFPDLGVNYKETSFIKK